jgi:hypothetical protein
MRLLNKQQTAVTVTGILIILVAVLNGQASFKNQQNQYSRVHDARERCEPLIRQLFDSINIDYPPYRILIRGFKQEQVLELWAQNDSSSLFTHIKTYPFTGFSGVLGPKRKQGDLQIPEGLYQIINFNPWSEFHLSLRLNYPNRSDSILGERGNLGGRTLHHRRGHKICRSKTDTRLSFPGSHGQLRHGRSDRIRGHRYDLDGFLG